MTGPYETEREARESAEVQVVYEALRGTPRPLMHPLNLAMLTAPCTETGVAPGTYGDRILNWLAGYEPATCAVLADLFRRFHEAGRRARIAAANDALREMSDEDLRYIFLTDPDLADRLRAALFPAGGES